MPVNSMKPRQWAPGTSVCGSVFKIMYNKKV